MAEKWWLSCSEDGDTEVIRGEHPGGEPQTAEELVVALNALEKEAADYRKALEEIDRWIENHGATYSFVGNADTATILNDEAIHAWRNTVAALYDSHPAATLL